MKEKDMDWHFLRDKTVETLEHLMKSYESMADADDCDSERIALERKAIINDAMREQQSLWLPYLVEFDNAAKAALKELFEHGKFVYEKMARQHKGKTVDVNAYLFPSKRYPALHPIQDEFHERLWADVLQSREANKYFQTFLPRLNWNSDSDRKLERLEDDDLYKKDDNWNEGLDPELTKDLHLSYYFHNIWEHSSFAYSDFIFVREFDKRIEVSITEDLTLL